MKEGATGGALTQDLTFFEELRSARSGEMTGQSLALFILNKDFTEKPIKTYIS